MEHLAILKKSWKLAEKILTGQKKIESRWYRVKHPPWDKIKSGETVYFKDSGGPVTIKAEVGRVIQFSNLTPKKVKEILYEYGDDIGIEKHNFRGFLEMFRNKRYCILIFLKNPKKIEPFEIDKTGLGMMSAWISVEDINQIKIRR